MAGPPQASEQNPAGGRHRPGGLRSWFAGLGLTQKIGTLAALVGIAVGVVALVREIVPAPQPSFKAQLTGAMAPLVKADGALSGQLEALEGTVGPEAAVLGVRGTAVATAQSAGQLNDLSTKGSSDARLLRQSALIVIARQDSYNNAVRAVLFGIANDQQVETLGGRSRRLQAAMRSIDHVVFGAYRSIAGAHRLKLWYEHRHDTGRLNADVPSTSGSGTGTGTATGTNTSGGTTPNAAGEEVQWTGAKDLEVEQGKPAIFAVAATRGDLPLATSCDPPSGFVPQGQPGSKVSVTCKARDDRDRVVGSASFGVGITEPQTTP